MLSFLKKKISFDNSKAKVPVRSYSCEFPYTSPMTVRHPSPILTTLQKLSIITHLEQLEALYYLLKDDMSFSYEDTINSIKQIDKLTVKDIIKLEGITPSIYFEIDQVLKGEISFRLDDLLNRPAFSEIKKRVNILKKYF
jgi:hypothetical protein